ncbi:hypothetical protein GJ744_000085 [Endocarpon pusillum]|uniref:Glycine zipper domain-containing protein n=1 Tax=Endocarpon pusillum TaxID=364733 RepID=A0A8H7EA87_9EURO|nr:hypothetical protein GJ744_000085 [Endocarpon pusillum]
MASDTGAPKVFIPSEADLKQLSEDERLMQAAQVAKAADSAQRMVDSLKSKAALLTDPKERERVLSEMYDHEIEAKGLSKKARILKSGTFQGAAGGAGIGAATGIGVGTLVGTLVGTVASVPTTALGGLVGAGTGAIHGPWIKLGGGGKEKEGGPEEKVAQVPQEAIDSGAVPVNDQTAKDPEALKGASSAAAGQADMVSADQKRATGDAGERKKPKKLEIRSNTVSPEQKRATGDAGGRRKPRKLEIRSNKKTAVGEDRA